MQRQVKNSGIRYISFPLSLPVADNVKRIIDCFIANHFDIDSRTHPTQVSDAVLAKVARSLENAGCKVEAGKKKDQKIIVPVLMGENNQVEKSFYVDAYHPGEKIVVEIEAGQAVVNFRFFKDIFEACMMPSVEHLIIAVRNQYKKNDDFRTVKRYLETLYTNGRLTLPLKSVVILGY